MINNLFRKNKIDDLSESEIEIEIEKPNENLNNNTLINHNISPESLMRDYESIKVLSMDPKAKNQILKLISESREDLQKIYRMVNGF